MAISAPGRGWLRAHPIEADALLAAGILAVVGLAVVSDGIPVRGSRALVAAVAVAGALPVVVRRWRPWWAVAGVTAAALLGCAAGLPGLTASISLLVVLYTIAAVLPLRQALGAALVLAIAAAAELATPPTEPFDVWIGFGLTMLVCFFVGRTVYTRHAYTDALEERARTAEASQEASAREAVLEERRRIARELHDVVAHHVSVMGVMATGARRALSRDPVSADEALATIEATGRATLRELRRLLDVLRRDDETDATLQPQPGLAGLEALAAQVREAGLTVQLTVVGQPRALDPGIDLTIYRIVQEGLTNALKHAGSAAAEVRVEFHPDRVVLRVDDNGTGAVNENGHIGHGLVGMRERVSLYGGTLRTGPGSDGGYSVAANIPIDPAPEVNR
jgi:signal transduction histidine kinase